MTRQFFKIKNNLLVILFSFIAFSILANGERDKNLTESNKSSLLTHPVWSVNSTIYEVNVRQYTPEGTFNAFAQTLPSLSKMGIGILWFMPINPIGELNRKGSLGSYYSVKDYTAINPEFGTLEDFKTLVGQTHALGMHVIIDWVANHTSWDNVWTKTHPDYYKKDKNGNHVSPFDWTDVISLDYSNKELWNSMRDAMKFWIEQCDIDGFRCDVAAMVPLDFWKWVRPQLEAIKPIFMLAEANEPELHQAFDMTYNWQLKDLFVGCAKGTKDAIDFYKYFEKEKSEYPADSYRMVFTSNHDENSWNGSDKERYGDAAEPFAVAAALLPGMPLLYNGQEAGLDKRLLFFEKDLIDWKENKMRDIYTKLFQLKKENKALWNGSSGGGFQKINADDKNIFAYVREKDGNKIAAFFNFSAIKKQVTISDPKLVGTYKNLFTGSGAQLSSPYQLILEPWGYEVFIKN
ncbi:MAG: alpha-amylase family glycosyl hydrolase [Ignavibacteriales bacterium]|nr:alpha-amylase family glycosyl hydrolase [Ignavibacteriales bacterium]